MKIYVSHSTQFDFLNLLYLPLQQSNLNDSYQFYFPHQTSITPINTREIIQNSTLVIAEVSCPSTGQGIELGWANVFNLPILCFYRENHQFSSSLQVLTQNIFSYNDTQDLLKKIAATLTKIKI